MQVYNVEKDTKLFCIPATSFPNGVKAAFDKLYEMLAPSNERPFYGISYFDDKGRIVYKAAVEESFDGEAERYGCETFVVTKGEYIAKTINDWEKNMHKIGGIFENMLKDPRADTTYPCVELYKNDRELVCMMRIKK